MDTLIAYLTEKYRPEGLIVTALTATGPKTKKVTLMLC